jgi:hypothetical protein
MCSRSFAACPLLCAVLAACGGGDDSTGTTAIGGAGAGTTTSGSGGEGATGTTSSSVGGAGGVGGELGPPSVSRIGETFTIPTLAASAPKRFTDVAHDPLNGGYLVVNGNSAISASYLDADAVPLGSPVSVAQTAAWAQGVRAVYGAAAQGFLVAWHDGRDASGSPMSFARIVRWDGAALVFAGDDFALGAEPSYQEIAPAIAYAEPSEQFLVAWQRIAGSDIRARFVSAEGALLGEEIAVTEDVDWQADVAIAYHPVRDEMLVSYTHAGATTEVRVQRVGMDGTLLGSPISLTQAGGTWLTQLAYLPSSGGYLAAWYEGSLRASELGPDGTPLGTPFELVPGYGAYDGFSMAMGPTGERFMAVLHGPTDEDFAATFDASGAQSEVLQATDSPGDEGHFNPHVAAHSARNEWLLVTSLGFHTVVGQRLGP